MSKSNLSRSKRAYCAFKRCIDLFGSIMGILVFSPVLIIVPIIIKCTSKGPVFFRQERIGRNKEVFRIFKFRSMRADAPEVAPSDMTEEMQKKMQYKFGSFLRKTSIDEIPQLYNIFLGQMAFIGPRPGAAHNEEELIQLRESYVPGAFDVRPGLGGYAQLIMHRDHDPKKKAELDHEYVMKMNLWLDIKIFVKTVFGIFSFDKGR